MSAYRTSLPYVWWDERSGRAYPMEAPGRHLYRKARADEPGGACWIYASLTHAVCRSCGGFVPRAVACQRCGDELAVPA